ncbi:MAG: L-threonylcarbamoyladenylate synthase [Anaplasma ovis]
MQLVVEALRKEQIVCFPTDTLYALACNALSASAVRRLYEIKRRQYHKPIPILLNSLAMIRKFALLRDEDWNIIERLTPGPVTFVAPLQGTRSLPGEFFRSTVGVRVPDHTMARAILREFGGPVAATSANLSGTPGARRAAEIPQEIRDCVSELVEDDSAVGGMCSTVFDVQSRKILRIGMFSEHKIAGVVRSCKRT